MQCCVIENNSSFDKFSIEVQCALVSNAFDFLPLNSFPLTRSSLEGDLFIVIWDKITWTHTKARLVVIKMFMNGGASSVRSFALRNLNVRSLWCAGAKCVRSCYFTYHNSQKDTNRCFCPISRNLRMNVRRCS